MDLHLRYGSDLAPHDPAVIASVSHVPAIGEEIQLNQRRYRVTSVISETDRVDPWPTPGNPLWHGLKRLVIELEQIHPGTAYPAARPGRRSAPHPDSAGITRSVNVLVRSTGGGNLGLYINAQHVPRIGEEIILWSSNQFRRARCIVRNVITATRPGHADHADAGEIILKVEPLG